MPSVFEKLRFRKVQRAELLHFFCMHWADIVVALPSGDGGACVVVLDFTCIHRHRGARAAMARLDLSARTIWTRAAKCLPCFFCAISWARAIHPLVSRKLHSVASNGCSESKGAAGWTAAA